MYKDYGYSEEAREVASEHAQRIMQRFSEFAAPSTGKYLCGDRLSALDIYWVFFSNLVDPLSAEDCPMPAGLRKSYEYSSEVLGDCDPLLIEQRDFILATHLSPPMTF
jgi:glutathione S-transferase